MGFNLYLAGGDSVPLELHKEDNVGILTTFADGPVAVKKFIDKRHCKTFCDSGAYGAAHSGKEINLDQYIEFINNTPDCDVFAVLDEIPWPTVNVETAKISSDNTWKNYVYMLERVKPEYRDKLVCAYHMGESEESLKRILHGIDGYKPSYIALGGRAGFPTKNLYTFLDNNFWRWIKESENPNVKVHAFGVTVFEMLERYPWYSADSTTWLRTGIAGNIHSRYCKGSVVNISDQRKGHLNHISSYPEEKRKLIMDEIESRGFDFQELVHDYKQRHMWNCLYYKDWADNFVYQPLNKPKRKSILRSRQ